MIATKNGDSGNQLSKKFHVRYREPIPSEFGNLIFGARIMMSKNPSDKILRPKLVSFYDHLRFVLPSSNAKVLGPKCSLLVEKVKLFLRQIIFLKIG